MAQRPKTVHLVDYLNASLGNAEHQGKIVINTIRPDKDSFRPHNVGLLLPQAKRLAEKIQQILTILLLLFLMSGCSSRVQVTTETETSESVEKFHTDVALGLLADHQESMTENAATVVAVNALPSPTQETPPPQVTKLVTNIHNVTVNVAGDLHFHQHHQHHTHFHEAPKRLEATSSPIRVEVQRRPIDPRCERLRREHLERTREWRRLFPNLKEG